MTACDHGLLPLRAVHNPTDHRFHAIVTDVSPKRDRDFTESVTD